jgi:hypothetical protein
MRLSRQSSKRCFQEDGGGVIADSFLDDLRWARPQETTRLAGRFENLRKRGPLRRSALLVDAGNVRTLARVHADGLRV